MTRRACRIAFLAATIGLAATAASGQWTEWGGEGRDFSVDGKAIAAKWPESGPRMLWKRELGDGESAILVDGGTLYTTYRDGDAEVVVALRAKSGEPVWEHRYAAPIPEKLYVEHGEGPHATPVIAGDRICTLGISGKLHCLDKGDGKVLWSHDLLADYGGHTPDCGYAGSPLVHGGNLIVQVGGEGQGVVAFKLADGEIAWKSGDDGAGYAAPVLIDVGGEQQVVAFMRSQVVGLEPKSGTSRWSHPHKTSYGVNGSRGLKLTRDGDGTSVEELWHQKKLKIHFHNAIRLGDHVYATSGDLGPAFLVALNVKTGEIAWQKRDIVAKASLLHLGGNRLLMLDEKGNLVLARVTPEDVTVHAQHRITAGRIWAPPTLVGTHLYVRDRKHAYAFDLSGGG